MPCFRTLPTTTVTPTIADGVLALVNMPDGTRLLPYPLDAVAKGTDVAFINARAQIKARWLAKGAKGMLTPGSRSRRLPDGITQLKGLPINMIFRD
jgi:hypothetical protein